MDVDGESAPRGLPSSSSATSRREVRARQGFYHLSPRRSGSGEVSFEEFCTWCARLMNPPTKVPCSCNPYGEPLLQL